VSRARSAASIFFFPQLAVAETPWLLPFLQQKLHRTEPEEQSMVEQICMLHKVHLPQEHSEAEKWYTNLNKKV
jgi:hypothetical protein